MMKGKLILVSLIGLGICLADENTVVSEPETRDAFERKIRQPEHPIRSISSYWMSLSKDQKVAYVSGVIDAFSCGCLIPRSELEYEVDKNLFSDISVDGIVEWIDFELKLNPENPLPLINQIFRAKLNQDYKRKNSNKR